MTQKEKKAAYNKAWYQENKEILVAKREANKERKVAYDKDYWEAQKDGLYTVYYLKEEHYVGMTTSLFKRLLKHKSKKNRHMKDVEIIGKYQTKEEAARVEAALHSMGYLGRNPIFKQQQLTQLI